MKNLKANHSVHRDDHLPGPPALSLGDSEENHRVLFPSLTASQTPLEMVIHRHTRLPTNAINPTLAFKLILGAHSNKLNGIFH